MRRRGMDSIASVLLFVAVGVGTHQAAGQSGIAAVEASVRADNIRAQDQFISDDLFEGRYPGLRGGELAAKYIATQFALDGLKPAGDDGTYLHSSSLSDLSATRVSFSPSGRLSSTFSSRPGELAPA